MVRYFNTAGACDPQRHYMVDIQERLAEIKKLVDAGEYFTINRARQYGKTTTLMALAEFLKKDYVVISLDFQMIGNEEFSDAVVFSTAFARYLLRIIRNKRNPVNGLSDAVLTEIETASENDSEFSLRELFNCLSDLCDTAIKPVMLMIDEADSATNNQVFLDFLAQLRGYYLARRNMPTFQSVILAGVYDVKNIKRKIRTDEAYKFNSPWNIAADFKVDMSFSESGIKHMLEEYEADHRTGMDVTEMSDLIYNYTSGYPFLVSRLCKVMDEEITDRAAAWTKEGFLRAVQLLLMEKNTLFESLMGKLQDDPELGQKLYAILFGGKKLMYNPDDPSVDIAMMFGFVKNDAGTIAITNRIFEMRLYNYFLAANEAQICGAF